MFEEEQCDVATRSGAGEDEDRMNRTGTSSSRRLEFMEAHLSAIEDKVVEKLIAAKAPLKPQGEEVSGVVSWAAPLGVWFAGQVSGVAFAVWRSRVTYNSSSWWLGTVGLGGCQSNIYRSMVSRGLTHRRKVGAGATRLFWNPPQVTGFACLCGFQLTNARRT